ncbi:MAG: hypothetical protein COA79_23660 [Planctomycetota bacterium]|nr:MAG: hypothetical protein COA79_23660 [Planctomycetota bacterium]
MDQPNKAIELNNNLLNCPNCGKELPSKIFLDFLKTKFIRLFLVAYAISFSIIVLALDIKSNTSGSLTTTINPYQASLTFAGIISIAGWYSQKRKIIEKLKADNG